MIDLSPVLPEKVTVYYPGRRCQGNASDTAPLWYHVDSKLSDVAFTDPNTSEDYKGVATAILIIHDACQALFDPSDPLGEPDNVTALDDLTDQIAQDFYDFRSFSGDLVYQGINAIQPTALWDYIEFMYDVDEPDNDDETIIATEERKRPRVSTRLLTEPWNGEVQEMQHMDPSVSTCTDLSNSGRPVEVVPCITYYEGTMSCTGGGAKAHTTINTTNGFITSVIIDNAGSFTTTPLVAISGDGTGAKFTAHLTGGALSSVTIDNAGHDYTLAMISFNGGGSKLQATRRLLCLEDGRLTSRFLSYDTIG